MSDTPSIEFPPRPEDRFFRKAKLLAVVDGDTLDVDIDVGWSMTLKERLRLEHVDTPETRGDERDAGKWVKAMVEEWLPVDTDVVIASLLYDRKGRVRGKYGRTVAHVYHADEGWCLNERLLTEKLAWQTSESGSLLGERSLSNLTGLPPELRP